MKGSLLKKHNGKASLSRAVVQELALLCFGSPKANKLNPLAQTCMCLEACRSAKPS